MFFYNTVAKLMPPRTSHVVSRPRILRTITECLDDGICWIAAPAGYGKTTAVADWVERSKARRLWYRVDEGDQDIASFFHYLSLALRPGKIAEPIPVFGSEYADQPLAFARRFLRAWFASIESGTVLVFDDLHNADVRNFRALLALMLHELPNALRCICVSRKLPPPELRDLALKGRVTVLDQAALEFSETEARALVRARLGRAATKIDTAPARGWAIGLVLLAQRGADGSAGHAKNDDRVMFDFLGETLFDVFDPDERAALLQFNLLPEITPRLAGAMMGTRDAHALLDRLYRRQLLVLRGAADPPVFCLHDLLREFLDRRFERDLSQEDRAAARVHAATILSESSYPDVAIDLALLGQAWPLAIRLIGARAKAVLAQGRRATFIDWCGKLPDSALDAWLCYWLGVAHMPDDAAAEGWLERAWQAFYAIDELSGQCLTVARAVLVKADSWRTHIGLAVWTDRAMHLLRNPLPDLHGDDELLVLMGLVRAMDFATHFSSDADLGQRLPQRLLDRLATRRPGESASLRLLASEALIEHAGSTGQADLFAQAVDSVVSDLKDHSASLWALGLWLVAFGAVSARYFPYARRGFPYADAEAALREAVSIGERAALRGVEFAALYHLQLQMKSVNRIDEFGQLIRRLAEIADSRYSTQVAVLADCEAAMHTLEGNVAKAEAACARIMATIEAANEPPLERWPHFITQFQTLLAGGNAVDAAAYLDGLIDLFDGAMHERIRVCILAAHALGAKWQGDPEYPSRLVAFLQALRAANWSVVLLNLPDMLAGLCADALDHGIEPDFCRALIIQRRLVPPAPAPASWPWALRIHVLGDFRLERDGVPFDPGAKPPTRSLDILRILTTARDHACHSDMLADQLWPDADGDRAKAACEQALHRLRKLLGRADLVIQREGKLRLAPGLVWVDLADWETRLQSIDPHGSQTVETLEPLFTGFAGPVLAHDRQAPWSRPAADRVRRRFLDLAMALARAYKTGGDAAAARRTLLSALAHYPESSSIAAALGTEILA